MRGKRRIIGLLLFAVVATGCSGGPEKVYETKSAHWGPSSGVVIWPVPEELMPLVETRKITESLPGKFLPGPFRMTIIDVYGNRFIRAADDLPLAGLKSTAWPHIAITFGGPRVEGKDLVWGNDNEQYNARTGTLETIGPRSADGQIFDGSSGAPESIEVLYLGRVAFRWRQTE